VRPCEEGALENPEKGAVRPYEKGALENPEKDV